MKKYTLRSVLLLAATLGLFGKLAQSATILELKFPYATKWAGTSIKHYGSKVVDFDHDGVADDKVKLAAFGTPQSAEYKGTDFYTNPGPELTMRAALALLDGAAQPDLTRIASPGVTPEGIRIEPDRKIHGLTSNSAYVAWWYIPRESFLNGGQSANFANGGNVSAECIVNFQSVVWRIMVKHNGQYFVSDAGTDKTKLSIADLASSQWVLYRGAEAGHDMRLKVNPDEVLSGNQLTNVEGIGIYTELIGYDATAIEGNRSRSVIDIKKLTVTTP